MVGAWIEHEWRRLPIHAYFDAVARRETWNQSLPRTLIAIQRPMGHVVGTVSILNDDMETRPDLNPWIG
jgi:hypothetical protein